MEEAFLWTIPALDDLSLLRANFVRYAFKRHSHDYYVIGMVESGVQQFDMPHQHFITLPKRLIVINPGDPHTGEAAVESGFRYRALYPSAEAMRTIAAEVGGRSRDLPMFSQPVIDDAALFAAFYALHHALEHRRSTLEHQSRYTWALAALIRRYTAPRLHEKAIHRERSECQRVRRVIEERFMDDLTLDELAALVHWSPYYLLRAFRRETGLTPHAYLESVRIARAQAALKRGDALADVAYATGFSSQSHFTTTFKRLIGVTPGHYAKAVNFLKDTPPTPVYADDHINGQQVILNEHDV